MVWAKSTNTVRLAWNGTTFECHEAGVTENGGHPLILVHGTGGCSAGHFAHLFPMMATRTRVLSVDWTVGSVATPLALDDLVAQVQVAADTLLGPDQTFDLLGYSLGAVVAGALAARLGKRVRHLILVAGWMQTDLQQALRNQVWHALYASDHDALRRYTAFCGFSGPFLRQMTPDVLESVLAQLRIDESVRCQMMLNAHVDIRAELALVTARTLIVSCKEDVMVPPHHQYQLLGMIDDARLTHVSSGHAVVLERPAELMQIVDLFLREPGRYPAGSLIPETQS